ncbi:uncharacterized [Tachysurus ichikawai]
MAFKERKRDRLENKTEKEIIRCNQCLCFPQTCTQIYENCALRYSLDWFEVDSCGRLDSLMVFTEMGQEVKNISLDITALTAMKESCVFEKEQLLYIARLWRKDNVSSQEDMKLPHGTDHFQNKVQAKKCQFGRSRSIKVD